MTHYGKCLPEQSFLLEFFSEPLSRIHFTELHNHRIVWVGRDLWNHLLQPPAKAGSKILSFWTKAVTSLVSCQSVFYLVSESLEKSQITQCSK